MKLSARHINWLNFGMFYGSCLFVCGYSCEEVIKHLKKQKLPIWAEVYESRKFLLSDDCWGFASRVNMSDGIYFLIVLKKRFDFKDESHAKLAHEILHLASFHISDFLDPMKENEAFTYLHTYLMTQCYKILRS